MSQGVEAANAAGTLAIGFHRAQMGRLNPPALALNHRPGAALAPSGARFVLS